MKPKLLLVSDTYHPKVDGTVRFIDEFVERAKTHFAINLLVPQFGEPHHKTAAYLETSRLLTPLPSYPAIALSFSNLRKIKQAVRGADIVFIQGPAFASFLAVYYARKYHKKAIFYMHVLPWELYEKSARSILKKPLTYLIQKLSVFFYNRCTQVLIPYQELKEYLVQSGVRTPLAVARLGVDIELFSPPANKHECKKKLHLDQQDFVIGYVGRISKEKNTSLLLEAFRKLKRTRSAVLLMVGDGDPIQSNAFRDTPHCKVTGFVDNVQDYLQAMDLFVMPSLTETTSLATLEAMATGLPVIATRVGFIKNYIIKDYNGVFFPRNSAATLALKIEKLMANRKMRELLGRNARKTVAHSFSWERSINKIVRRLLSA
ncbi:glycosyltransferase family 4 protein [Candidatus Woesearchaeota archaeon]|nr:glycosyltransferase family 4 protein [Candidatus Woesearchaeota archaeon]